jgi:hypothetical protein
MMVCTQCRGNGYLQHNQAMTPAAPGIAPNFTFYGDNKQWPETVCPTCLDTGIQNGSMA